MTTPTIEVGILFSPVIRFQLNGNYTQAGTNRKYNGRYTLSRANGRYLLESPEAVQEVTLPLLLIPDDYGQCDFDLTDVVIGINFHWERTESQKFKGTLKLIDETQHLTAIDILSLEDYLLSVISSEMSASSPVELLKAHAVISRSWLLCQLKVESGKLKVAMQHNNAANSQLLTLNSQLNKDSQLSTSNFQLIKWYDREDHVHFDVCADDHCQRYQGITRASTEMVEQAIQATRGQVLTSENKICDARFSKCCGGAFEEFQYCWEDVKHPYLVKQRDSKKATFLPDLRIHSEAEKWIRTSPDAFCNTKEKRILSQVLNNYDQETTDFYRWKVEYTQEELAKLIFQRSGIDYGQVIDLIPIERGTSARISKLKIIGTKKTLIIGKELEIRRTLSPSHLYSSAFVVDKTEVKNGIPGKFILTGAGWGHGVGLCQIGAAVMGEQGYAYDEILLHYYIGAAIEKLY